MEIWRTTLEKKIYAKLPNSVKGPELTSLHGVHVHVVMRFIVITSYSTILRQ